MAKLINLRQKRKEAARAASALVGAQNAVKYGRSKGQKHKDIAQTALEQRRLEGHRRRVPSSSAEQDQS